MESRPAIGETEFGSIASEPETQNWWLTGERLLHVPEVMQIEGWSSYGSPGNMRLSRSQRHLMLWSDIVGQVANGGIVQFFENYDGVLEMARSAVDDLAWPELSERYGLAMADYIHIEGVEVTLVEWRSYRANEHQRMQDAAREVIRKAGKEYVGEEYMLQHHYLDFVNRGLIEELDWEYPHCEAFDSWFYSAACKADSIRYVGTYIRARRAELCIAA